MVAGQVAQIAREPHAGGDGRAARHRRVDRGVLLRKHHDQTRRTAFRRLLALERIEAISHVPRRQHQLFRAPGRIAPGHGNLGEMAARLGNIEADERLRRSGRRLDEGLFPDLAFPAQPHQQDAFAGQLRGVQNTGGAGLAVVIARLEQGCNAAAAGRVERGRAGGKTLILIYPDHRAGGTLFVGALRFCAKFHDGLQFENRS